MNKFCTVFLVVALSVLSNQANASDKETCKSIIKTHGMLTRGQFQCGFSQYNGEMTDSARECSSYFSEQEVTEIIKYGMELFDYNVEKRGSKKAMCNALLKEFPNVVRK